METKNKNQLVWRIYYADGSIFSNLDGLPEDAPPTGVICIKQLSAENRWELQAISDYYIWNGKEWWRADAPGFWLYMFRPGLKIVKFGENLQDFEFQRMMARAREDTSDGMERIT